MISEIANSLFLTYLASEYLVSNSYPASSSSSQRSRSSRTIQHKADKENKNVNESNNNNNSSSSSSSSNNKNNYALIGSLAVLVGIANLLDHHYYLSVVWEHAKNILPKTSLPSYVFVIPTKLCLAASSYVMALYIDIHRDRTNGNTNTNKKTKKQKMEFRSVFLPKVGWAFLKILPAYPFLAVVISFLFLFVIDLWEWLGLPLEWLNNPIYYGTLYGPFAYTYVHVKNEVLRKAQNSYHYNNGNYARNNDAFV